MLAWKCFDNARSSSMKNNLKTGKLIFPDEIHDLLRWSDWVRAYRATAKFFDRKLAACSEQQ